MLIIYASLLVIGSVLTASAVNARMFIVGHVLQGPRKPAEAEPRLVAAFPSRGSIVDGHEWIKLLTS